MSYIHPAAAEHQRKRFTRPDAWRFAPPGTPEARPPGYLHPSARIARAEEAKAAADEAARGALEREFIETFHAEHLQLRRDLADLTFELAFRRIFKKYREGQPRDERGRWVEEGGATDISAARKIPPIVKEFGKWTARQYVSRYCEAKVNRELPGQFENMTISDIWNIAKGGDARARTCMKLLNSGDFRK